MDIKKAARAFLPLTIIFVITSSLFLSLRSLFIQWGADTDVLVIGNIILFLATAFSFYLYYRSVNSKNAQVIVRMVYSGMIVKLFVCLVAAFVYISMAGKTVSKGAIIGCFIIYLIYTYTEVVILMKLSKQH